MGLLVGEHAFHKSLQKNESPGSACTQKRTDRDFALQANKLEGRFDLAVRVPQAPSGPK
jgi:hypothetical protein